jgi:hypothetical protein
MSKKSSTGETIKYIGELLIHEQLISREMLNHALDHQQRDYKPLGRIFIELKYISEEDLNSVLAKQFGIVYLNPHGFRLPDKQIIELIPESMARKFGCFPIGKREQILVVAMADPWNTEAINALRKKTNLTIQPKFSRKEWILDIINAHYHR